MHTFRVKTLHTAQDLSGVLISCLLRFFQAPESSSSKNEAFAVRNTNDERGQPSRGESPGKKDTPHRHDRWKKTPSKAKHWRVANLNNLRNIKPTKTRKNILSLRQKLVHRFSNPFHTCSLVCCLFYRKKGSEEDVHMQKREDVIKCRNSVSLQFPVLMHDFSLLVLPEH